MEVHVSKYEPSSTGESIYVVIAAQRKHRIKANSPEEAEQIAGNFRGLGFSVTIDHIIDLVVTNPILLPEKNPCPT